MSEQQMGQQSQEPIQVTLNDVASIVQLIDVVSRRGGIQGNEMAGVGMLRDKLEQFLKQNMPEQDAAAMDATAQQGVDVATPLDGELAGKVL
jgi:hypothetical protein